MKNRTMLLLPLSVILVFVLLIFVHRWQKQNEFRLNEQPLIGNAAAKVSVVEFGDFKCPACKQFEETVFPQIKSNYIDTGKIKFYFKNFDFIGPDSSLAAQAGESIFKQNNQDFWSFYQTIYHNQGDEKTTWATEDTLLALAKQTTTHTNLEQVKKDLDQQTYLSETQKDKREGEEAGVVSTPSIFINGTKVSSVSYDAVSKAIDAALQGGSK